VFSVEISTLSAGAALAESMMKMREWLDRHQVEPSVFRYNISPPGLVFRVEFAGEEHAIAFAKPFGGQLVVGQTSPSDFEHFPVPVHRGHEDTLPDQFDPLFAGLRPPSTLAACGSLPPMQALPCKALLNRDFATLNRLPPSASQARRRSISMLLAGGRGNDYRRLSTSPKDAADDISAPGVERETQPGSISPQPCRTQKRRRR
jgi:hypothetical protein